MIYLDHAATTPLGEGVLDKMLPYLREQYANPSAPYLLARNASVAVEAARRQVATLINALPEEIFFTSGGTESNNWVIQCIELSGNGDRVLYSAVEPDAVRNPMAGLSKRGAEVGIIPVDRDGCVSLDEITQIVNPQCRLIAVMHANNEIGTIQPVAQIVQAARQCDAWVHVDAVQTVGHIEVDVQQLGCDSLSMSAHKFYGPKGVGALYVRKGGHLPSLMLGGGQERGRRSGTLNVAGIVGMGEAASLAALDIESEADRERQLRDQLIITLENTIGDIRLLGHPQNRLPNNVCVLLSHMNSEEALMRLDMAGICASNGSACHSGAIGASHVMSAIGLSHEEAGRVIRFTLGRSSTVEHIDAVVRALS